MATIEAMATISVMMRSHPEVLYDSYEASSLSGTFFPDGCVNMIFFIRAVYTMLTD